eukprot:TRINITY_DN8462_c0_g1_i1.p1 TRINITY_DN8462_c0_g1~~TRINITY_DN8462_c0_g1_i1.p1  ORF type:complete len:679 (+),score=131.40 TRINITY_DN8462_c0_g1_i1:88-2124(+)
MKFGKRIGDRQAENSDLYYVEYKLLKKKIKDVVGQLQASELAEALSANSSFEDCLAAEIKKVNACFADRHERLLRQTAELSEVMHMPAGASSSSSSMHLPAGARSSSSSSTCAVPALATSTSAEASSSLPTFRGEAERESDHMSSEHWAGRFQRLVRMLSEMDELRKYAVWNAVAVVKILKKRRKQTSFGLEDTVAERAGWLARQSFFSGSDFSELHAAIVSLGHALVARELGPVRRETLEHSQLEATEHCPICFEIITDPVELSCKHRFCWKCFVLGPIAFQPGEYRISQCPVCRHETSSLAMKGNDAPASAAGGPGQASLMSTAQQMQGALSSETILTRFLHTYFPAPMDSLKVEDHDSDIDVDSVAHSESGDMKEVVGQLVKALLPGPGAATNTGPLDFFQTLPAKSPEDKQAIGNMQKLQWLQMASSKDPLDLDSSAFCSLCSEPLLMDAVVTTACKHHFHRHCVKRLDLPECPLCCADLPFSWFIPADNPFSQTGFRVVKPLNYKPSFAGGPSKGTSGYPLHSPPPLSLHVDGEIMMRSYLHKVIPMGTPEENDVNSPVTSPILAPQAPPTRDDASSASSSSTDDDNSGSDLEGLAALRRDTRTSAGSNSDGAAEAKKARHHRRWAYSAVGRVRLLSDSSRAAPFQTSGTEEAPRHYGSSSSQHTVLQIAHHV